MNHSSSMAQISSHRIFCTSLFTKCTTVQQKWELLMLLTLPNAPDACFDTLHQYSTSFTSCLFMACWTKKKTTEGTEIQVGLTASRVVVGWDAVVKIQPKLPLSQPLCLSVISWNETTVTIAVVHSLQRDSICLSVTVTLWGNYPLTPRPIVTKLGVWARVDGKKMHAKNSMS